jgi:hypothetical protein
MPKMFYDFDHWASRQWCLNHKTFTVVNYTSVQYITMNISLSYINPSQIFASIAVAKGYTRVLTLLVLYVSDSHKRTSLPTLA